MKRNNQPDVQQMLGSKQIMEQVAKSPDAQALAGLLAKGHNQASLKRIAEDAARGDTAQLKELIGSITSSPDGAELLRRLSSSFGK